MQTQVPFQCNAIATHSTCDNSMISNSCTIYRSIFWRLTPSFQLYQAVPNRSDCLKHKQLSKMKQEVGNQSQILNWYNKCNNNISLHKFTKTISHHYHHHHTSCKHFPYQYHCKSSPYPALTPLPLDLHL